MKMTRSQADKTPRKTKARHDAALRNTGKSSYRVVLKSKTTTHADFTDLPLLQAVKVPRRRHAHVSWLVRNYTRAFFDKNLKGMKATLLDDNAVSEFVEAVQKFEPAKGLRPGR